MRVLFIGGTGVISTACSFRAIEKGFHLYLLNRGRSYRPAPADARLLKADIHTPAAVSEALGNLDFDAVVDFIAFGPDQVQADLDLFRGRTGQYVFISSASAYQTPPTSLPVTESTLLDNPYWEYSRKKIACEELLVQAYRREKYPITIVRPSHTYDQTLLPFHGGYTFLDRVRKGKPVIIQGDGTSLWTLTHSSDFAKGLVGLLGNSQAIGEAFHITSDEWLTWNQIAEILAGAAGASANLVHIPSDFIARFDPQWGASLLGDKSHSMIFDNRKIKRVVPEFTAVIPFTRGAAEIVAWYDADPARREVDEAFDQLQDRVINAYQQASVAAAL